MLRAPLSHDHLSIISALTPDGGLLTHMQEAAFKDPTAVVFLHQLLRLVRGKLIVNWDGAAIHRAQPVKDFLAAGARSACTWRSSRPTHPTSIPTRASGITSSAASGRTAAAVTSTSCVGNSVSPFAACAANPAESSPVSAAPDWFSSLCSSQ